MIARESGGFTATCDRCPSGFVRFERGEAADFKDVVAAIKRGGWRIVKIGRDWLHLCPDCAKENHAPGGVQRPLDLRGRS